MRALQPRRPGVPARRRILIVLATAARGAGGLGHPRTHSVGLDLTVRSGTATATTTATVGPVAVALTSLIAGLAGWALLAVLERTVARPARWLAGSWRCWSSRCRCWGRSARRQPAGPWRWPPCTPSSPGCWSPCCRRRPARRWPAAGRSAPSSARRPRWRTGRQRQPSCAVRVGSPSPRSSSSATLRTVAGQHIGDLDRRRGEGVDQAQAGQAPVEQGDQRGDAAGRQHVLSIVEDRDRRRTAAPPEHRLPDGRRRAGRAPAAGIRRVPRPERRGPRAARAQPTQGRWTGPVGASPTMSSDGSRRTRRHPTSGA